MNHLLSIGMQNQFVKRYGQHFHKSWEITYYCEGSGINITNEKEIPFQQGTIICQPPMLCHEDISQSGYKNIYFCVEQFNFPLSSPLVFQDSPNGDFLYVLRQLYNEYYSNENNNPIIDALLNVLYQYTLKLINMGGSSNLYVRCLERELIENFSDYDFSLTEAMQKIPMNTDHLRRLFERDLGKNPAKYLQDLRIHYAMQLLQNSTLPINNICIMAGYRDPYYFSRIFKKHTGLSPENWRLKGGK